MTYLYLMCFIPQAGADIPVWFQTEVKGGRPATEISKQWNFLFEVFGYLFIERSGHCLDGLFSFEGREKHSLSLQNGCCASFLSALSWTWLFPYIRVCKVIILKHFLLFYAKQSIEGCFWHFMQISLWLSQKPCISFTWQWHSHVLYCSSLKLLQYWIRKF